jgi:hypothetical protein
VLAELPFQTDPERAHALSLVADGPRVRGQVDDVALEGMIAADDGRGGAAGFILTEGTLASGPLSVMPA